MERTPFSEISDIAINQCNAAGLPIRDNALHILPATMTENVDRFHLPILWFHKHYFMVDTIVSGTGQASPRIGDICNIRIHYSDDNGYNWSSYKRGETFSHALGDKIIDFPFLNYVLSQMTSDQVVAYRYNLEDFYHYGYDILDRYFPRAQLPTSPINLIVDVELQEFWKDFSPRQDGELMAKPLLSEFYIPDGKPATYMDTVVCHFKPKGSSTMSTRTATIGTLGYCFAMKNHLLDAVALLANKNQLYLIKARAPATNIVQFYYETVNIFPPTVPQSLNDITNEWYRMSHECFYGCRWKQDSVLRNYFCFKNLLRFAMYVLHEQVVERLEPNAEFLQRLRKTLLMSTKLGQLIMGVRSARTHHMFEVLVLSRFMPIPNLTIEMSDPRDCLTCGIGLRHAWIMDGHEIYRVLPRRMMSIPCNNVAELVRRYNQDLI